MITITVSRMITRLVTIIITTSRRGDQRRTQVGFTHADAAVGTFRFAHLLLTEDYMGANNSLICIRRDVNPCSCR